MPTARLDRRIEGGWKATGSNGLAASGRYTDTESEPSRSVSFETGTGSSQIDVIYRYAFTISASGNLDIDLKGGTSEKDVLNNTLSLAKVRSVDVVLTTTPAAGVSVRVGPQSVSNGWVGPFMDADGYAIVRRNLFADNPVEGWTVDNTHKILRINNPGAASVSGVITITGTSA